MEQGRKKACGAGDFQGREKCGTDCQGSGNAEFGVSIYAMDQPTPK
jgi:hypothetical protein